MGIRSNKGVLRASQVDAGAEVAAASSAVILAVAATKVACTNGGVREKGKVLGRPMQPKA